MPGPWYESFFHGIALDCWRRAVEPELTGAEADFLWQELETAPGARLLDMPCGHGRHALELGRRGCRMTGVDISGENIAAARGAAAAAGMEVEWIQSDMRRLAWDSVFDGGYCWGNSFGYLDHAGTVEFLAALARSLKPGARFVLDYGAVAEALLPALKERQWFQVDDILFLADRRYQAAESRLDIDYTFIRGGVSETRPASQMIYTAGEIGRLLAAVGLETLAAYGSTGREPFRLGSPRLILASRKG